MQVDLCSLFSVIHLLEKGEMVRIWGSCIRTNSYEEERILTPNIEDKSRMSQHQIFEDAINRHFQSSEPEPSCHISVLIEHACHSLFPVLYVNREKYSLSESVRIQHDVLGLFPIFYNQFLGPISRHISGANNIINITSSQEDRGWNNSHFLDLSTSFVILKRFLV